MRKIGTLIVATVLGAVLLTGCANTATTEKKAELSNTDKAVAVVESFTTGNPQAITDYVSKDDYVQHNLTFPDGRQTMLDALPELAKTKTTVEVVRSFEDGDYVVLHSKYNLFGAGEQVGFDVFKFKDGIIVEHWDNLAALAPANPSGHTQLDGTTDVVDIDQTEANKTTVKNFVNDVLVGKNPGNLTSYFNGDNYIQHNPNIADGLTGLGAALSAMKEAGIDMIYTKVHAVYGEGNFVLVISEGTFAGAPTSYYDLFRVEDGKIAEHWDVMETIANETDRANSNGKF